MGEAKQEKFRAVVGVDFGEGSSYAVLEGMRLARLVPRMELAFVHVMEVSSELHDARLIDALSDSLGEAMSRLERYVRDVLAVYGSGAGWGLELSYHVRVGPVARELHQVAVDVDAEMIIVGKRPARALRKLFHRSPVEELVRMAHVPVVVARPKDYRGFAKSPSPEPPRPGQDITRSGVYASVDSYESGRSVPPHIAGLI